jgi:hypothetical protein
MITLRCTVKRGKARGEALYPHKHEDGRYVASITRFKKDYIRVDTIEELIPYVKKGFCVRMSKQRSHRAPSLISPESIEIVER